MQPIDDALLRKVSRQLRLLNVAVTFFGILILISFVMTGFLAFKAYTFVHNETTKINNIQKQATQALDIKQQFCDDANISAFIKSQTGYCD